MPGPPNSDEIRLISDGDGVAVLGDPTVVEAFLAAEGLPSRDLGLPRPESVLSAGAAAAQVGSMIAANSGRWVKLTKESARSVNKYGLRRSSATGLSTGVVRASKGQIRGFVEFAKGPGTALPNPALLANAGAIMAQVAMQQAMNEITAYLATIDEKVDDILRAQKDDVVARVIGTGLVIDEAMTIRGHGGRVNVVTWSKVQTAPATIAEVQAYALCQLDAAAEKLERATKIGDLAEAAKDADVTAREWLAVLARCFQLQDAVAVLELDRVLDAAPDELDGHRLGLRAARQERLEVISRSTEHLLARMEAAAGTANTKVLFHPSTSPAVVRSSNQVARAVGDFHSRLGIECDRQSWDTRGWLEAATDSRNKVLEAGAQGVDTARRFGKENLDGAMSVAGKLSRGIAVRYRRANADDENGETVLRERA